jgi:hypothetical protein
MEIVDYKYDNTLSLEIIDALYYTIVDYFNPASFINREGQLISGSQQGRLEFMAAFIGGIQTEIENALRFMVQQYFLFNSFPEGYRVEVIIPRINCRNRELDIEEVKVGAEYCLLDVNECRGRLRAEGLDDEAVTEMLARWAQVREVAGTSDSGTDTTKAATKLSKSDLPEVVDELPSQESLSTKLETDLHKMIDDATKEIIDTLAKASIS